MKHAKHLITACALFLSASSFSQFAEGLLSITEDDKILFFDCQTSDSVQMYDLNALLGNYNTLNKDCTSDPFNNRYFFGGSSDSSSLSGFGYYIFNYDLMADTVTFGSTFWDVTPSPYNELYYGMMYDIFENRLIYTASGQLRTYNLIDYSIDTLVDLPMEPIFTQNQCQAYDGIHQQYFYLTGTTSTSDYHFILFDTQTGNVISDNPVTIPQCVIGMQFDFTTSTYYGITPAGHCVSIDPLTGIESDIVVIPGYGGLLNEETSAFDYKNHRFIMPYYSDLQESRLAIIDVINHEIVDDYLYPMSDLNQYFGTVRPAIQVNGDVLKTVHAAGYQWFVNGVPELGATDQTFTVDEPGDYFAKVYFPDDHFDFTDTITISGTGFNEENLIPQLVAAPSPFNEYTTIDISTLEGSSFSLNVYAMTGEKVLGLSTEGNMSFQITKTMLEKGLYYFIVESEGEVVGKGKVIAQ